MHILSYAGAQSPASYCSHCMIYCPSMQGMIELILATDMAKHTEFMEKYKQALSKGFEFEFEEHRTLVSYSIL